MDYTMNVCHIAAWIEINIRRKIDYAKMEKSIGYSYHHIRDFFKHITAISLSRYILARKIANAAFEIRHNKKSIIEIAEELEFSNIDTFTRVFNRVTGLTPSQFKKSDFTCGRQIICPGVYAPVILGHDSPMFTLQHIKEVNAMSEMKKTADSCILYGVPKVYFGREVDGDKQTLPFPICLQSVLNYMGQNISYTELVAYSGEAFRQRWECNGWSPAAIDPRYIYERPLETYERAFNGAGRKFILSVDNKHKKAIIKDDAIALIKAELDCGRPVIALGVVGPPEACIITGYKDDGETVLGWSLFQEGNNPWSGCEIDESGYFVKRNWWTDTQGIMVIGEEIGERASDLQVLENALRLMTTEEVGTYDGTWPVYGAQKAYEKWAQALEAEEFKLGGAKMGQKDAERMAGEGRHYAAIYMEMLAEKYPELSTAFITCAQLFKSISDCVHKVTELREAQGLENKKARTQMATHIRQAAKHEWDVCAALAEVVVQMGGYSREGDAMYNEEELFAYLADKKRANVHEHSRYLDELFSLTNGNPPTHETISVFMENVRITGGGTGLGAAKMAYQVLNDYAECTASKGDFEFTHAFDEHLRQAFEEPVRIKMGEFKNNIAYIPADTKINPEVLAQAGLTNEEYVTAFRVLQEKVYDMYDAIEATSPFEWGWATWHNLTVGNIRYGRILSTLNCLAHYNELDGDVLVVCADSFFMWDWNKMEKTASRNTLKKMAEFGFVLDGIDNTKAKTFTMSCPDHTHVMRVIFTLNEKIGNEIRYSAVQDPATLPPTTTFKGIFAKGIMEYEGIEYDDFYGYSFNGKRIARISWNTNEKSLRLWLKNVLQKEKYKDELEALPKAIKSKFKLRPRKPCPCGQQYCYTNHRNEKVFTYTFEGAQYEMCEQRSFIFKNLDIELIPVCLRLLEVEYGLKLCKKE